MHKAEGRSHLFTLRIWPESTGDGAVEWRGKVQRVADGETLYFRDWSDLHDFVFGSATAQGRSPAAEQSDVMSDGHGDGYGDGYGDGDGDGASEGRKASREER